jgi:hypothetical protein
MNNFMFLGDFVSQWRFLKTKPPRHKGTKAYKVVST